MLIEPTETEPKRELDRFAAVMIARWTHERRRRAIGSGATTTRTQQSTPLNKSEVRGGFCNAEYTRLAARFLLVSK